MTLYAGETVIIKHTATLDGEQLTNLDVSDVLVSIYEMDDTVLLSEVSMPWSSVAERWEYSWSSPGPDAGKYRVKIRVSGLDGSDNWEYQILRTKTKIV